MGTPVNDELMKSLNEELKELKVQLLSVGRTVRNMSEEVNKLGRSVHQVVCKLNTQEEKLEQISHRMTKQEAEIAKSNDNVNAVCNRVKGLETQVGKIR